MLFALAACHGATPPAAPSASLAPPFPPAAPRKPATAIDFVHHLERLALDGDSSELPRALRYEIRTAHQHCKPAYREIPAAQLSSRFPPTSALVIATCPVPGVSHPSPGVECIPPTTKTVFTVLVDRDATGELVIAQRSPAP